jgi:hypothetical protein
MRIFGQVLLVEKQRASYLCKTTSKESECLHKSYAINVFAVLNMANQRPKMTIIWKN